MGDRECPEHLKQYRFKPGESGNPAGRPKRPTFESLVEQVLDMTIEEMGCSKREALALVFVDSLLKRNTRLIHEYLAREWPAVQKHEVELPALGPDALSSALDRWLEPVDAPEVPRRSNGSGEA